MPDPLGGDYVLPNGQVLPNNTRQKSLPGVFDYSAVSPDWSQADPTDPVLQQAEARFGRGALGAVQNVLSNLWDFIKVPGDIYKGQYSLEDMERMAPGYALRLAGAASPIGAAAVPEESLGLFGGVKALTRPKMALTTAEALERERIPPETINALGTGWFRGAEGLWRHTISDEAARLNLEAFRPNQFDPTLQSLPWFGESPLSNVLHHPDLFSAYPELGNYPVSPVPIGAALSGVRGALDPKTKTIRLAGGKPENILSTILHEAQHGIQDIEGFASGGSVELPADFAARSKRNQANIIAFKQLAQEQHPEFTPNDLSQIEMALRGFVSPQAMRTVNRLHPALQGELWPINYEATALRRQSDLAYKNYRSLAGEVEARAVQEQLARRDWATPIWQHEGYVPFGEQIIRVPVEHDPFATSLSPTSFSLTPVEHDPFGVTQP